MVIITPKCYLPSTTWLLGVDCTLGMATYVHGFVESDMCFLSAIRVAL